jgi:adenylate cyclase
MAQANSTAADPAAKPAAAESAYRFTFEPHSRRVRAMLAGVALAESARCVVLRETRLAPVFYFPREDVRMDLLRASSHRSYCPIRGNASYWSAVLDGRREDNIAWSYDEPLPEAARIKGHLAFYAERLDALRDGEQIVTPGAGAEAAAYANPLLGWLLAEAPGYGSPGDLTGALAARMVAAGIPLWRMTVLVRTLHPELVGTSYRWWRKSWAVEETRAPHSVLESPEFLNSPFRPIFEGAGGIRRRLEGTNPVLDFGILEDLHAEGGTDYVAMPLLFSDGTVNVITLSSDRRGGFGTSDLGHVYEILGVLGRLYEMHAMRRTAVDLLDTYLGRHAGERVLQGTIRRGDGENIGAVIWFCDLRESTPLARAMTRQQFLDTLNQYFDCMAGAVLRHGGQVLRYIGDAALAIFPVAGEDDRQAREQALAAAREAAAAIATVNRERAAAGRPEIGYGIGLHVGEVTYGNIGTPSRLEFTVIGEAANMAARVESLCKELDRALLVSAEFARFAPERFVSLGRHRLKGIDTPQELYTLRPEAAKSPPRPVEATSPIR